MRKNINSCSSGVSKRRLVASTSRKGGTSQRAGDAGENSKEVKKDLTSGREGAVGKI